MSDTRTNRIYIWLLALLTAATLLIAWCQVSAGWFTEVICREDGPIENLTAIFYLTAAAAAIWVNRRYRFRNAWLWCYAILFFVVGGEEISWGQRLFDFETPAGMAAINVQQEFNVHNLGPLHGSVRLLGSLVVLGLCCVIPLLVRFVPAAGRLAERWEFPVFPLSAAPLALLAMLIMVVPRALFGTIIFEIDEWGEFVLAAAFLSFGIGLLMQSTSRSARPSP